MKIIAWVILVIAVGCTALFVFTGLTDDGPAPWLNGWMLGPILLIFVAPMMFSLASKLGGGFAALTGGMPKEFRGAPIAMGTVVSANRTGLSINDQPQLDIVLDVQTADGQSFRGVARQIIDLTDLAAVAPGASLPVRYLPGSTDGRVVLATDGTQEELQAAIDQYQLATGKVTPRQQQIGTQGIEARSVVLAMSPTGEIRGDRSVLALTLRVTRPDGTTFDLEQEKAIPLANVAQLQPGMIVRTKYLPSDESEVVFLMNLA